MFRETHFNRFNKGKAIIRDYKDGITQCYLINTKGELVYKFEPNVWADNIEDDNVIFAREENIEKFEGTALFDLNGRQLTDFKYQTIYGGVEEGFFEVESLDNKHGHISITGKEVIPCIYEDGHWFSEGVSPEKLNGKWGMINWKNETVIPFEYEAILRCNNNNRISAKLNGKWGIIDKFNNTLIDFKYDEICNYLTRDCGSMPAKMGDKWGIIDIYGSTLFDFIYDDCGTLDQKGWYKFKQNGKWAIFNCEKNCFISDFIYDEVDLYVNGICEVRLNGKDDCIDETNTPISDFTYDFVRHFYRTNLIVVTKNGKTGLMNMGGKILIIPKYKDRIKYASENMLVWEDDNFNQYVTDINMNIIIPKKKYQNFYGGYNSGIISMRDSAYYNTKGEKLELKFEL